MYEKNIPEKILEKNFLKLLEKSRKIRKVPGSYCFQIHKEFFVLCCVVSSTLDSLILWNHGNAMHAWQ